MEPTVIRRPVATSYMNVDTSARWVEIEEAEHGSMFVNLTNALSLRYDRHKGCTVLEWPNGHYVKTKEEPRHILAKAGMRL